VTSRIPRIRVLAAALALTTASAVALGAATDADADQSRVTIHRVTIPAAHFQPTSSQWVYSTNYGSALYSTGTGYFTAPIPYSYDGTGHVFITRVEVIAYDNDVGGAVCVTLQRAEPTGTAETAMGYSCTSDSPLVPQTQWFTPAPRRVNAGQRAYLKVSTANANMWLYAVRVTYTTNP